MINFIEIMSKNSKKVTPGTVLRLYRKLKFLTQQEVADLIGVSQQQYQKYELWKSKPSYEVLEKLIKKLEIPPNKLFDPESKIVDLIETVERKLIKNKKLLDIINADPNLLKILKLYALKNDTKKQKL